MALVIIANIVVIINKIKIKITYKTYIIITTEIIKAIRTDIKKI
jgi:hypothetical protein